MSFSMETGNPEILKTNILEKLEKVAHESDIELEKGAPSIYFVKLIRALCKKYDSQVVALIDDYDAPVTKNISNLNLAKANAAILHDFLGILKDLDIFPYVRFTFVIGVDGYGLYASEYGPDHLNDISLDPRYADICGFTADEFDQLFSGRMEDSLAILKEKGEMNPLDEVVDLKAKIFNWYGGYNWGEKSEVLNPYSVINFFEKNHFDGYWVESRGRDCLTAASRKRPLDFLAFQLKSNLSERFLKSELASLKPIPVLFHRGYLAVDEITKSSKKNLGIQDYRNLACYAFRQPNFEIASSYFKDLLSIILSEEKMVELPQRREKLKRAILKLDSKEVSAIIGNFISSLTSCQKPKNKKDFHIVVHTLLYGMGFNLRGEAAGSDGRLNLIFEIEDKIFVIIELKYVPLKIKISVEEENKILADLAMERVSMDPLFKRLAYLAYKRLSRLEVLNIRDADNQDIDSGAGKRLNEALSEAVRKSLPEVEINAVLAEAAKTTLPEDDVLDAVLRTNPDQELTSERIDEILTRTSEKALKQIAENNYHGVYENEAKAFIDMGLAIYGHGADVKVLFGPSLRNALVKSKKNRAL
jgi:hypothetical protein